MKFTAPNVAHVIDAISDEMSLRMFKLIKERTRDTESLRLELKLSRKQCYDRLQDLMNQGLIKREKRYYTVTAFGQVVDKAQAMVNKGIENRSALEIADTLMQSEIPRDEYTKLILNIIHDPELKEIVAKQIADNLI